MRYLLVLLGLMVANTAQAVDCQTVPSCEELGYTKEVDPNCKENGYISCPFDTAYKKCVNMDCEKMGFTKSDKSSWCASIISCKSDSAMTLCQKPCFATTYEELSSLAGSGKCKVVTMRNDINIPQNRNIVLAANTILDGGNHTLTSTGDQGYNLYYFADKTGLKNINIVHTHENNIVDFYFSTSSTSSNQISFENVNIKLTSSDSKNGGRYMFYKGTYNITGKFVLDDQSANQVSLFQYETYKNFTNADVHILTTHGNSDVFSLGNLTMENSTVDIQSAATVFIGANDGQASFKNTKGTFRASNLGVIYGTKGLPRLVIQEGCDITLRATKQLTNADNLEQTIELSGTPENPTKLTISDAAKKFGKLSVEAHDLNVTLVINGKTYKPKKAVTTLLSAIETSSDWAPVQ